MISSLDLGECGPELVFLHANGYPPACYRPLLAALAGEYRVSAMLQRPLWPGSDPGGLRDWRPLTDDLLEFLEARIAGPAFAVGHSMGGIALLRAALRAPGRFRAIALLDPVLFPPAFIRFWRLVHALGLGERLHPLVSAARHRRRRFDDLGLLYRGYRRKAVFQLLDDDALQSYIEGIACPDAKGGFVLCYPVEWETRIYITGLLADLELWRGLPRLSVPALFVRGEKTDTFLASTARRVTGIQPRARTLTIPQASHLLPLERPAQVCTSIDSFFKENA